jgi:hypothetical protein
VNLEGLVHLPRTLDLKAPRVLHAADALRRARKRRRFVVFRAALMFGYVFLEDEERFAMGALAGVTGPHSARALPEVGAAAARRQSGRDSAAGCDVGSA